MKQENLFEELEKQLNAEAKEQKSITNEVVSKRGRPVGSVVKKTYKAEELLNDLESKGGTPDKSFQMEVEPGNCCTKKTCSSFNETEIEETFRVIKDLARLLKKLAES